MSMKTLLKKISKILSKHIIINHTNVFLFLADGVTYSFGVLYNEFITVFKESKGATAWVASLLVGITLCSGNLSFKMSLHKIYMTYIDYALVYLR